MPASPTDRARWPWWLAAALVAAAVVVAWPSRVNDAAVPAAAPAQRVAAAEVHGPAPATPAPVLAGTPPATHAPALKLVGTAVGGAGSFATVRRTADAQLLMLRVGDRVDGLAVAAVEPGRMVLAGAGQRFVLEVDATPAGAAPPVLPRAVTAPPAAPAPQPAFAEGEAPWDAGANFRH